MNKRVQKKVAKRIESELGELSPKSVAEALEGVENSARQLARSVVNEVQERAEKTLKRVRAKVAKVEEQAEGLLEKVPVVGSSAAKALHERVGH